MNLAIDNIIRYLPIKRAPTVFSKEVLLKHMSQSSDGSIYLPLGEFSDVMAKSERPTMFEFLTSMYDGKDVYVEESIGRGEVIIVNPCLNMFGATTPAWMRENMSESIIGGGFASRLIAIYADKLRNPKIIYNKVTEGEDESPLLEKLRLDLEHISTLEGDFEFAEDAAEFLEQWHENFERERPTDARTSAIFARKPQMVMKLAMIFSVAYKDDLILTIPHLEFGIRSMEIVERQYYKVFGTMGGNKHKIDMAEMMQYIIEQAKKGNPVIASKLMSKFSHTATPGLLKELVQGLVTMGDVIAKPAMIAGRNETYLIPNAESDLTQQYLMGDE